IAWRSPSRAAATSSRAGGQWAGASAGCGITRSGYVGLPQVNPQRQGVELPLPGLEPPCPGGVGLPRPGLDPPGPGGVWSWRGVTVVAFPGVGLALAGRGLVLVGRVGVA